MESNAKSSSVDFLLDELVESVPWDSLSSIASHGVDDLNKLIISVPVFQLLTDVSQVVQIELSFSLHVQQGEVRSAAFLAERISLSWNISTILLVSYLKNCSKSSGAPLVES